MAWDPITRIVGSLGIYTKIDFAQKRVAECHSTSSIFRGYSIFMKGKDPRDAHFITSRICGICGDNHATCSVYNQNMAYGVAPPHLGEWIINLGEAAEYMFDHNIFQENLVGVDYCEKMVAETNPGVLELANRTESPHAADHGYKTIGDIMRALNPFTGEFYREALQVSRYTREMFCLMEGRHVHPSTLYPGGVGTVATDPAVHRLLHPAHALRGVHEAGRADARRPVRLLLRGAARLRGGRPPARAAGLLGLAQRPGALRLRLPAHDRLGPEDVRHAPASSSTASSSPTTSSRSTSASGSCSARSFYRDWEDQETFVTHDPLGNPVDQRHPWNQHHDPGPAEARLRRQVQLDDVAALVRRHGPPRRSTPAAARWPGCGRRRWPGWSTSAFVKSTGHSVQINLPRTVLRARGQLRVDTADRQAGPAAVQRDRAQPRPDLLPGLRGRVRAALRREGARRGPRRATPRPGRSSWCPTRRSAVGFTEAVRGVLSHHMVIRGGKIANYHPYPPTPWNGSVRDTLRHARPVRGRRAEHADLRGEPHRTTSRASTSCGRSAASTRACPAACTCTWATGSRCTRCTRPPILNVI